MPLLVVFESSVGLRGASVEHLDAPEGLLWVLCVFSFCLGGSP